MLGYSQLKWKKGKLYQADTFVKVWYEESKIWPKQYHVCWDLDTKDRTKQVFNKTNTKDNGKILYLRHMNEDAERACQEAADAF